MAHTITLSAQVIFSENRPVCYVMHMPLVDLCYYAVSITQNSAAIK